MMKNRLKYAALLTVAFLLSNTGHQAFAADNMMSGKAMSSDNTVMVGGAPMYTNKNIVENAMNSRDHTTLVAAIKAGGLVETLAGPGPFTVFAPTNEAFGKLPAGTVDSLVKPENKAKLDKILTYHVVPGDISSTNLMNMVKDGNGQATLTTVEGEPLTVKSIGGPMGSLELIDAKGGTAAITIADVKQSNGIIHVVDTVLMPAK